MVLSRARKTFFGTPGSFRFGALYSEIIEEKKEEQREKRVNRQLD
jgi:hypothetical protein